MRQNDTSIHTVQARLCVVDAWAVVSTGRPLSDAASGAPELFYSSRQEHGRDQIIVRVIEVGQA